MHQCIWKGTSIIGTYGGRERTFPTPGTCSKMIFNIFQGIKEDDFFSKLTRLQQIGSIEEFTHQWESLLTWVFGLSKKQWLESYLGVLKPYLQKELKLHDIPNVEVARYKAKAAERKLEGIRTRGDNHQCHKPQSYAYERENRSKSSNSYSDNRKKKKNICRRCGDDWTSHKCRNNQTIQCKIINGEEVQVSTQETSFDSNTDTKSEWKTTLGEYLSFEDKSFLRGRKCYNNKIVNN